MIFHLYKSAFTCPICKQFMHQAMSIDALIYSCSLDYITISFTKTTAHIATSKYFISLINNQISISLKPNYIAIPTIPINFNNLSNTLSRLDKIITFL